MIFASLNNAHVRYPAPKLVTRKLLPPFPADISCKRHKVFIGFGLTRRRETNGLTEVSLPSLRLQSAPCSQITGRPIDLASPLLWNTKKLPLAHHPRLIWEYLRMTKALLGLEGGL
jgi:hypothetical protein